mmetsp:Transcript_51643/g.85660  ORF Transcript_51643/g.85660 Transcript_51643/m.85660 type:complete len:107 (+) Transcript_51643:401-721(+)
MAPPLTSGASATQLQLSAAPVVLTVSSGTPSAMRCRPDALLPAEEVRCVAPVANGLDRIFSALVTGENEPNGVTCPRLSVWTIIPGPGDLPKLSAGRCCTGDAVAT